MKITRRPLRSLGLLAGLFAIHSGALASASDATIKIDRALNSPTITVRYAGAMAALAELKLNGVSVGTRTLSPASGSGETNFEINLTSLQEGDNEIEIRLFDKTGNLVGSQRSVVTSEQSRPAVFLSTPKMGATVQGPIEIKVGFGKELRNTYVSFFVDSQFKLMTNFPPYAYLWDTGREPNGWHEVEAWVVDDSSDTHKTRKIRVFVNNPGGRTERLIDPPLARSIVPPTPLAQSPNPTQIPALTGAANIRIAPATVSAVAAKPALTALAPVLLGTLAANPTPVLVAASDLKAMALPASVAAGFRNLTPTGTRVAPTLEPTLPSFVARAVPMPSAFRSSPGIIEIRVSPSVMAAMPPPITAVAPLIVTLANPVVAPQPASASSGVKLTPAPPAIALATPRHAEPKLSPTPAVVATRAIVLPPAAPKPANPFVAVEPGVKLPNFGAYAILFNGHSVAFDVQPTVQDGVPVTPFRHLVEHQGGKIDWEASTKTVTANTEGRTVWVRVGNRLARIDSREVEMELAPYLKKGRTIVPLSFIRDALNVRVEFDPATGHV
ncbi:MAG: hypothetical protein HY248_06800, partial [Fimbriimonas ginsengisoli]|nr:hypothetical protein [Fimbriimonas ginsengisoli]